jgi:putative Mg2+ transporter-C (MgtC) family protein
MNPATPAFTDPIAELLGPWAADITIGSIVLRLLLSLTLGAIIGWERSNKRHSAGLRTFMLAFLIGSLASLLDSYVFAESGKSSLYILSGATIIGASVIAVHSVFYSSRNQIKGLTMAVGLVGTGVIGLTVGCGLYFMTAVAFVFLLVSLSVFPSLEVFLKNRSNHFEIHLELTDSHYLQNFVTTIRRLGLIIDEIELNPAYANSGLSVYTISISISSAELKKYKTHEEIIQALQTLDYVYHIEEMNL